MRGGTSLIVCCGVPAVNNGAWFVTHVALHFRVTWNCAGVTV